MAPYAIDLHDEHGVVAETRTEWFAHDDHAIDHAGRIGHRYGMTVRQGDRLAAHFPPPGVPPKPIRR